jgi:hypothetical protein
VVDPVTRRSEYDGLKDVAQAASLGKFKARLAFLQNLDALGPTEKWLEAIPPGKVAHFAGEARVTDVAGLRKVLDEDKRLTLIVSLLHTVRTGVRDDVVTMFCKRMAAIHKRGRDQPETLRETHRAESERLLGVFGDVLDGVREAMTSVEQQNSEDGADAAVDTPDKRWPGGGDRAGGPVGAQGPGPSRRSGGAQDCARGGFGPSRQQLPAAAGPALPLAPLSGVHLGGVD